jgi:hypothetical protein
MDAMKKATREEALLRKYMSIVNDINDGRFEDNSVWRDLLNRYKGAKKQLSGENLLRKLDLEMMDVQKFASRFPGFNNPAELPSGRTQLRQMKNPVIPKLWTKLYLVMSV